MTDLLEQTIITLAAAGLGYFLARYADHLFGLEPLAADLASETRAAFGLDPTV